VIANAADQDIDTAIGAAQNETLNNFLSKDEIFEKKKDLALCLGDPVCRRRKEALWNQRWNANLSNAIGDESVLAVSNLKDIRDELQPLLSAECKAGTTCHSDVLAAVKSLDNLIAGKPLAEESTQTLETITAVMDLAGLAGALKSSLKNLGKGLLGWFSRRGDEAIERAAIDRARISNNVYADGSPLDFPRELQTSSGIVIRANPDKTTTVLGSFRADTDNIMSWLDYPKSMVVGGSPAPGSFNRLNIPDEIAAKLGSERFWNEVNKPFLDAAIKRGDDIVLTTRPDVKFLFKADGSLTFFGREIQYLESRGFNYDAVSGSMKRIGVKG
jgi:hypothetical protein